MNSSGQVNVIVQYQQAPAMSMTLKQVLNLGGDLKLVLGLVKAVAYTIPVSALTQLAALSHLVYISPDRSLSSTKQRQSQCGSGLPQRKRSTWPRPRERVSTARPASGWRSSTVG